MFPKLYKFKILTYLHLLVLCEIVQAEENLLSSEPPDPAGNDVGCQTDCDNSAYPSGYAHASNRPHVLQIHSVAPAMM
jgi:hypothetical protein